MNIMKLPVRVNPIIVKELRSRMRGGRAFLTITILLLLTGGALLAMVKLLTDSNAFGYSMLSYQVGSLLFDVLVYLELFIVCTVAPAVTAGAISGEVEKLTFDLLLATPLSPARILLGKLVSSMSYILLLLFAAIPLASIVFIFGGITLSSMLKALMMLCIVAVMSGCMGLFFSTWLRRTGRATIVSLLIMALMLIIPVFISIMLLALNQSDLPRWLLAVSPMSAVVSSTIVPGAQQGGFSNPLSFLFLGGMMDQSLVPISHTSIPRPVYHYSLVIFSGMSILFFMGAVCLIDPIRFRRLTLKRLLITFVLLILLAGVSLGGYLLTADHYEWYRSDKEKDTEMQPTQIFLDETPVESQKVIVPEDMLFTPTPIPPPIQ